MVASQAEGLAPPEFLKLAGHPLRWQLLGELARSDLMVHELTVRTGQPQNLVSYHLGKLRDARLVSARRSSADGRDAYYTVDIARFGDLLLATGAALHPGLRLTPPAPETIAARAPNARVLFLCTGNSARSQMAEALIEHMSAGTVRAASAGSHPKPLHPNAVRVMRKRGIDISGNRTKHLDEFVSQRFDQVITLCDRVREVCPEFPSHRERVALEHARSCTSRPDQPRLVPRVRSDRGGARDAHRVPDPGARRVLHHQEEDERVIAMSNNDIVSVRYMVDDVDAAVTFYTKMLGFDLTFNAGPPFAEVRRGNLRLLLAGPQSSAGRPMSDGEKPGPGGWNRIHFVVDDIDAEVARLRDAGATFRNDIVEGPGGKQILLLDPSDNIVELFQPAG